MKKIHLIAVLMLAATFAFGQKAAVVSAYNYHKDGKLDKAKSYIDKAITHEKTMNEAKTWFYRGNIYIDIYRSSNEEYKKLDPDALYKAYEAYQKAMQLDEKKQYSDDIKKFMPIVGESYFNDGAGKFNEGMGLLDQADSAAAKEKFKLAVSSFETAYNIYKEAGANDSTTLYYVSVAAELAEDYDKARSVLEHLISIQFPKASIYTSLANIYYKQDKDAAKADSIYALGRERFPDDLNLLLNQTNFFLSENKTEEALSNLEKAAEMDSTNATIFFAIGAKYNEIADDTMRSAEMRKDAFHKAIAAYDQSISIDPNYFDPIYNMGALYVNKASALLNEANELPFEAQEEFEAMKKEADEYLKKSLPYLEKAHELQPDDVATMASLKEIYIRLNMLDKAKEIEAKMQ